MRIRRAFIGAGIRATGRPASPLGKELPDRTTRPAEGGLNGGG